MKGAVSVTGAVLGILAACTVTVEMRDSTLQRCVHLKNSTLEITSARKRRSSVTWFGSSTLSPRYDFFTAFMSYGMDRRWKRNVADTLELHGDELALDLACGTGDITFEIARRLMSGGVIGLDITRFMVEIAHRKQLARGVKNVSFNQGDIMRLPFADETFNCITGGYALRNVPDIAGALSEIKRVLKPGGRFVSLDFGHPPLKPYRWLYLTYLTVVGSVVGFVMHGDPDTYRYIPETLKLYPGQRGVKQMMDAAGFVKTGFLEFGGGIMAINYCMKPS